MDNNFQYQEEESLNIKRYVQIAYQHKWLGLTIIIIITALASLYALSLPEKYQSSFTVFNNCENSNTINEDSKTNYSQLEKAYWLKTMESNKIYELLSDLSGLSYSPAETKSFFSIVTTKDENLYEVELKVNSPDIIPELANGFVRAINTIDQHNQSENFINKIKYLNNQIDINNIELDSIDYQILELGDHLNVSDFESANQLKQARENFKTEIKSTEVELSYIRASKNVTQRELNFLNDTLFAKSSFTEPLKVQLMNLQIDLARAYTKYGEEHPVVKGIKENIVHVEEMLIDGFEQNIVIQNITSNPIKQNLMGHLIDIKIKEISLEAKISSLQKIINNTSTINSPTQGLYQLLRKRESLLGTIDFLSKKIIDMGMAMNGVSDNFYLVDQAIVPANPSNKSLKYYIIIGIFAGMFAAAALIFVYDFLDDRIKLVDDFSNYFSIPIIGALRHRRTRDLAEKLKITPIDEVYEDFESELTNIRVNLKQLIKKTKNNILGICSSVREDGKTILIYLLGLEYAKTGKKVLLLDFDIYLPKLSSLFSMTDKPGVQDFLLSDGKFEDLIENTEIDNLDIMPLGNNPYKVKVLFDSIKTDELFTQAASKYDLVLIDTPALLLSPGVLELLRRTGGNILVTRIGHSSRKNITTVLEKLKKIPSKLIGTILTDIRPVLMGSEYDKYYKHNNYYYSSEENEKQQKKSEKSKRIKKILLLMLIPLLASFGFMGYLAKSSPSENNWFKENIPLNKSSEINVDKDLILYSDEIEVDSISKIHETKKLANVTKDDSTEESSNKALINSSDELNDTDIQYHIIAGCFSNETNADSFVNKLNSEGYNYSKNIGNIDGYYIVSLDSFTNKAEAVKDLDELKLIFKGSLWLYKSGK